MTDTPLSSGPFKAVSRLCVVMWLSAGLAACAAFGGERGVDAPFPKLSEIPTRPEPSTTREERANLREQLKQRRDRVNQTAQILLRGGTEPVPVALESELPRAPDPVTADGVPGPVPEGLPKPPAGPGHVPETKAPRAPSTVKAPEPAGEIGGIGQVKPPTKGQMPPARAAKAKGKSAKDRPAEDKPAKDRKKKKEPEESKPEDGKEPDSGGN